MVNFVAGANSAVNLDDAFESISALVNPFAAYTSQSSNAFAIYVSNAFALFVEGSGFNYSGPQPVSGTVTSLGLVVGGLPVATVSGFSMDYVALVNLIGTLGVDAFVEQLLGDGDTILGSSLNDVLFGKGGEDVISGLSGNDRLYGDAGADILYGGEHNDQLFGREGGDDLFGEAGDDFLVGGSGYNEIDGGAGNDTASFSDQTASVRVTLNGSAETLINIGSFIRGSIRNVENATGGDGDDALTGDGLANFLQGSNGNDTLRGGGNDDRLLGGSGNDSLRGDGGNDDLEGSTGDDLLDGGIGSDVMEGGSGDDTYVVDYIADTVVELAGQGIDTVLSSATFVLAANVENLTLTGGLAIDATGNGLANALTGNAAGNRLDGRGGADHMSGGNGNDTYVVDNAGDVISEAAGEGRDSVEASVSFALGSEVEDLLLTGTDNLAATGNALANAITGNVGNNTITGGLGRDALSGGDGSDSFVFDVKAGKKNADTILDFEAGADQLLLHGGVFKKLNDDGVLKAKFFASGKADDGNDYITYKEGSGKLYYDKDGEGGKQGKLIAILKDAPDLASGDIVLF
jgi:Ca2+-binding RTX toxin-like protein